VTFKLLVLENTFDLLHLLLLTLITLSRDFVRVNVVRRWCCVRNEFANVDSERHFSRFHNKRMEICYAS